MLGLPLVLTLTTVLAFSWQPGVEQRGSAVAVI
jgi:hypothetical protein